MKRKFWYPVVYMFVVTACFSAVIIGFAQMTSDRVWANQQIAFEKAVLAVLPVDQSTLTNDLQVHQYFNENVQQPSQSTGGAYTLRRNNTITAYALPIEGQGFWAPIKAITGISADKKTITGFAVYEQRETPGLGAEVAQKPFTKQFDKLVMADGDKLINFKRPEEKLGDNEVHAVTGATQTSTRLEKIINAALNKWRKDLKTQ